MLPYLLMLPFTLFLVFIVILLVGGIAVWVHEEYKKDSGCVWAVIIPFIFTLAVIGFFTGIDMLEKQNATIQVEANGAD